MLVSEALARVILRHKTIRSGLKRRLHRINAYLELENNIDLGSGFWEQQKCETIFRMCRITQGFRGRPTCIEQ